MKGKILTTVSLAFLLIGGMCVCTAHAHEGCSEGRKGRRDGDGYNANEMLLRKARFIFLNKEELGVSDEQLDKINKIKIDAKKKLILKDAETAVVDIDINMALWEDAINVEAMDELIDKKCELEKAKDMIAISAYVALKESLSAEQKEKIGKLIDSKKHEASAHGTKCNLEKKSHPVE